MDIENLETNSSYRGEAVDFMRRVQQLAQNSITNANHQAATMRQQADINANSRIKTAHQQADNILGRNLRQVLLSDDELVIAVNIQGDRLYELATGPSTSGIAVDSINERIYWAELAFEEPLPPIILENTDELISVVPIPLPTPTPTTTLLQGQVAIYRDANYQGPAHIIQASVPNIGVAFPGFDNQISSFRLGPNTALTIYDQNNFVGRSQRFTSDVSRLGLTDLGNDNASSLLIASTVNNLQPGQVALYGDSNYRGQRHLFSEDVADFSQFPGLNDQISSLQVGPNTIVTLYDSVSFSGEQETFGSDIPWLGVRTIGNDRASSLRIRMITETNVQLQVGEVALYEHENFGGRVWVFNENISNFQEFPILDNRISSVRLGPSTQITLFANADFTGTQQVITSNTSLVNNNDAASSLQIRVMAGDPNNLQTGQVALYEKPNYDGRVVVVDVSMPDFRSVIRLNDNVSSVRVGPNTQLRLFSGVNYAGVSQVFNFDTPSLGSNFIGDNTASSLTIQTSAISGNGSIYVKRANIDGNDVQTLAEFQLGERKSKVAGDIVLDFQDERYFLLAADGVVYSGGLDGGHLMQLTTITSELDMPVWSIAYDVVNKTLYASDGAQIWRINPDGTQLAVVQATPNLIALAVDALNGMIYWHDGNVMMGMQTDGTHPVELYRSPEPYIGLVFDDATKLIYWTQGDVVLRSDVSENRVPEAVLEFPLPRDGKINDLGLFTTNALTTERLLEVNLRRMQTQEDFTMQIHDAHTRAISDRAQAQMNLQNQHTIADRMITEAQNTAEADREHAETMLRMQRQMATQMVAAANQNAAAMHQQALSNAEKTRQQARDHARSLVNNAQNDLNNARRRQHNS